MPPMPALKSGDGVVASSNGGTSSNKASATISKILNATNSVAGSVTTDYLYAVDDTASGPTPSTPPSSTIHPKKSQCSSLSEGEYFEGYGEIEFGNNLQMRNNTNGICGTTVKSLSSNKNNNNSNDYSLNSHHHRLPHHISPNDDGNNNLNANVENSTSQNDNELNIMPRDNWSRRSFRRTPTSSGRRQISSNALASQLYRSSSFNSPRRSSNCDTTKDMYSDVSLDNRHDYDYRLQLFLRKVDDLSDPQNIAEVLPTTEYDVLQARYDMLEEQYRESELRAEERLAEELKRHREILARVERKATLQNENCQMKIRATEIEANALSAETQRLRVLCDKQANDLHSTEEKLELVRDQIVAMQQELDEAQQQQRKYEQEKKSTEELMVELSAELQCLREENGACAMPTKTPESIRLEELYQELKEMRQKNRTLKEQNEELQAAVLTRGVEEGRHLLNGTLNNLAQELEEISQAQDSADSATLASLNRLQQAFQEKEEENTLLKHYIDTIFLNIVQNHPQLLEMKPIKRKYNK